MKKLTVIFFLILFLAMASIVWISSKVEGVVEYLRLEHGLDVTYSTLSANLRGIYFSDLVIEYQTHRATFESAQITVFWKWPLAVPGLGLVISDGQISLGDLFPPDREPLDPEVLGSKLHQSTARFSPVVRGIRVERTDIALADGSRASNLTAAMDSSLDFQVTLDELSFHGQTIQNLEATGTLHPAALAASLEEAALEWQDHVLRARGHVGQRGIDMHLETSHSVDIRFLKTRLDIQVRAHGQWQELHHEGSVTSSRSTILGNGTFPDLRAEFHGDMQQVEVNLAPVDKSDFHLRATVPFDLETISLQATFDRFHLHPYLLPHIRFLDFDDISGEVEGSFSPDEGVLRGAGVLDFSYNAFHRPLKARLSTAMDIDRHGIRFHDGTLNSEHFTAEAGGELAFSGPDFFRLWSHGEVHDLAPILESFWVNFIDGNSRFAVSINGPATSPLVDVAFDSNDLRVFQGHLTHAFGSVQVDLNHITLHGITARTSTGEAQVSQGQISVYGADDVQLRFPYTAHNIRLEDALAFGNLTNLPSLPRILEADGQIEGEVRDLQITLQGSLAEHQWREGLFSPKLSVSGALLDQLVHASIEDEHSHVRIQGNMDFGGKLNFRAAGQDIPLSSYMRTLPAEWSLLLDSYGLYLSGTFAEPRLEGTLGNIQLENPEQDISLWGDVELTYAERVFSADITRMILQRPLIVSLHGSSFLHDMSGETSRQELFLRTSTEHGVLETEASLRNFSLEHMRVEGALDLALATIISQGALEGRGTVDVAIEGSDTIRGTIAFGTAAELFAAAQPQLRMRQLRANVTIDRLARRGSIDDIAFLVGRDGTGEAQVSASLNEQGLLSYSAGYQLHNVLYQQGRNVLLLNISGSVSGDTATEPQGEIAVDIRRGQLNIDRNGAAAPTSPLLQFPGNWTLNVQASSPIRFSMAEGSMLLLPQLQIRLQDGIVYPRGRIQVLSGSLLFNRDTYTLQRGSIEFSDSLIANLNLSATTTKQGYQIVITITGTSDEPRFLFRSVPSLPQEHIISLLLLGSYDEGLSPASAASHILANRIAETLNEITGPALRGEASFRVSSSGLMSDSPDIALTSELSQRLEVRIARELSAEGTQQFQVIYKIFDFLYVRGREHIGGSYGIDIEYRIGR